MAKQIKGNAASKAAPKSKVVIREPIVDFVKEIEAGYVSLNTVCLNAALWCLKNKANADEVYKLKGAVDKRRWADMVKIITCKHKIPANAPNNLIKLAQWVRNKDKGATPTEALKNANGTLPNVDMMTAIAKRKGEPAPAPTPVQENDDAAVKGAQVRNDEPNAFEMLKAAFEELEKQYGKDCPDLNDVLGNAYQMIVAVTEKAA